jgi:hypothetical protein
MVPAVVAVALDVEDDFGRTIQPIGGRCHDAPVGLGETKRSTRSA